METMNNIIGLEELPEYYEAMENEAELATTNREKRLEEIIEKTISAIERDLRFCSLEAEGTMNDKHCRIAIMHYKSYLKILRGEDA